MTQATPCLLFLSVFHTTHTNAHSLSFRTGHPARRLSFNKTWQPLTRVDSFSSPVEAWWCYRSLARDGKSGGFLNKWLKYGYETVLLFDEYQLQSPSSSYAIHANEVQILVPKLCSVSSQQERFVWYISGTCLKPRTVTLKGWRWGNFVAMTQINQLKLLDVKFVFFY